MTTRSGPSGIIIPVSFYTEFYGAEPANNVAAQTGGMALESPTFSAIADPALVLGNFAIGSIAIAAGMERVLKFSVQRRPADADVVDPTGDNPVTFELQFLNLDTLIQTDVAGSLLSFAVDEFGIKEVDLDVDIPIGVYLYPRCNYPTNWTQGDREVTNYVGITNGAIP